MVLTIIILSIIIPLSKKVSRQPTIGRRAKEDKTMTRTEWLEQYGAKEWVHPKTGEVRHYLKIEKIFKGRVLLNREKGMKIFVLNDNIVFKNVNAINAGLEEFLTEAYTHGIICEEVRDYQIGYKIYGN